MMPRLVQRPSEIAVDEEWLPQGEARGQAIRLSAQPLPGDQKNDAVERVRALMKYLQAPKKGRKIPRVGDYSLKIDYRPAGHGEAQIGVTGLPVYTDYHGPGYKYSWQKVK